MALKTLLLRKQITDAKKELETLRAKDEDFVTREAELETSISEVNTEEERDAVSEAIDAFEAERTAHEDKKADLERQVAELEAELQNEEAEQDVPETPAEERKEKETMEIRESKEYLQAYAHMIHEEVRNGKRDETQVRALLTENATGGTIPIPTYVEGRIRTAWERNGIMDLIRKSYIKGNLRIGFEYSATGATKHIEGDDSTLPDEEVLEVGAITLVAHNYKKWIRVSDEVLDTTDEEFLDYVLDEIAYQISKAVVADLLGQIAGLNTTASANRVSAQAITKAPALDTVAAAVANLSDEADDNTAVLNKLTYADFIAAMAAGHYSFDPFQFVNRYRFNSTLPAYSAASAGAVYMIVGDFEHGAQANFPNGADIKFTIDNLTESEKDLNKVVGRQYLAVAPVAINAFCNVKKPQGV